MNKKKKFEELNPSPWFFRAKAKSKVPRELFLLNGTLIRPGVWFDQKPWLRDYKAKQNEFPSVSALLPSKSNFWSFVYISFWCTRMAEGGKSANVSPRLANEFNAKIITVYPWPRWFFYDFPSSALAPVIVVGFVDLRASERFFIELIKSSSLSRRLRRGNKQHHFGMVRHEKPFLSK